MSGGHLVLHEMKRVFQNYFVSNYVMLRPEYDVVKASGALEAVGIFGLLCKARF